MERQYSKYDSTLVLKPIFSPFDKPIVANDDNSKLIENNSIKSNSDYRRYVIGKSEIIREHNTKEYVKSI